MPNMIRLMATQERGLLRDTRLLLPAFVVCYFFVMVRVPGFVMLGIISFSPTYGAEYTKLKRVSCGMFDAGIRKRDPKAVVQSACMFQTSRRMVTDKAAQRNNPQSGHIVEAYLGYIPAAKVVEADANWAHAKSIRAERPARGVPTPKAGPAKR